MKNQFKLKAVYPFALSSLFLALAGCGGESAKINEDPNAGVVTSTNGCDWKSETCQPFAVAYPISGLNFDCKLDTQNHFETLREGNIFTGGCAVGDKVSFYIQGQTSSRKINLGVVDLAKIGSKVANQPIQISLLDIASGMTGKPATAMDLTDETYRVMVEVTRLLQALGVENGVSKSETDVQPIELRIDQKNDLSILKADVDVKDFLDGSYLADLAPWLNVGPQVSEASAIQVVEQQLKLKNVTIYNASFFTLQAGDVDFGGFHGASESNPKKETISNLYLLTDRQGHSMGYTVQWTGVPVTTGSQVISSNARINLLTQVTPIKSNLNSGRGETSVNGWINPLNDQIQTPLSFKTALDSVNQLNIFQGKILNQKVIAGNQYYYKQAMKSQTAPDDNSTVYGRWDQILNGERFKGAFDLTRINPATYLENNVFKTTNTVRAGEKYVFPLYATLTFKFSNNVVNPIDVGIVIDENGDIRTNRSATSLASDKCNAVQENYMDADNVQQYRIGTTGATNSTPTDNSITLRMIFANQVFNQLDGAIVGFNSNFATLPSATNPALTVDVISSGARINIKRLIDNGVSPDAINISDWNVNSPLVKWDNMHAVAQEIYNVAAGNSATTPQLDLAKLKSGTIEQIKLLNCSTYITK